MRRKVEEGLRLGSIAVLAGAVALSALVLYETKQVKDVLGGFPEQMDKVVASDELHYGLLAQAYFMRGYMLYRDPICLDEFHRRPSSTACALNSCCTVYVIHASPWRNKCWPRMKSTPRPAKRR